MCCSPNVCMCCVVRALRCDLLPAGRVGGECLCMCVFVYVSACVCECVCAGLWGCGISPVAHQTISPCTLRDRAVTSVIQSLSDLSIYRNIMCVCVWFDVESAQNFLFWLLLPAGNRTVTGKTTTATQLIQITFTSPAPSTHPPHISPHVHLFGVHRPRLSLTGANLIRKTR